MSPDVTITPELAEDILVILRQVRELPEGFSLYSLHNICVFLERAIDEARNPVRPPLYAEAPDYFAAEKNQQAQERRQERLIVSSLTLQGILAGKAHLIPTPVSQELAVQAALQYADALLSQLEGGE